MTFEDDKQGRPRRKSPPVSETPERPAVRPAKKRPPVGEVGQALRSVYDRTVREDIPPEMLDLLGKLG